MGHSERPPCKREECIHAILNQDIQTLLDRERSIEYDEPETERKNIVAGADFEEVTDGTLHHIQAREPVSQIA